MIWKGVFPATTTPFREDLSVDHELLERHAESMISAGCRGIVPLGSLGESATLDLEEKIEILATCRRALAGRAPLVAGVAALSTAQAVAAAGVTTVLYTRLAELPAFNPDDDYEPLPVAVGELPGLVREQRNGDEAFAAQLAEIFERVLATAR